MRKIYTGIDIGSDTIKIVVAEMNKDNFYATQFHPEKSGSVGLAILKAFCEIPTPFEKKEENPI